MMRTSIKTVLILTILQLAYPGVSSAQYPFGKNKVHYAPRDWKVIETAHTEIFYYPDELHIAEFIAGLSEDIYKEYSGYFGLEFDRKIPIVLYGTHHDFKETNIIPYLISEATGGFTEFIKGRVALPFVGSYGKLKSVFRHEMVHVFMLEKLRVVMRDHRRFTYSHPPLWFTEGLAEYIAHGGLDSEADMFLRDAVTSGRLYPLRELWKIQGTYMMYKEGESALHYIATRFGDDAIRVIHENWWKSDKFDVVLRKSIGLDVSELSRDWEEFLRKKYYPSVLRRRRIDEIAETLSPGKYSFENHPVCINAREKGERIFSIGFGLGSIDIVELEKDRRGRWKKKTFIRGGSSTRFESIPVLRSRISARGDTLIFVSKVGERDAIYLYDVNRKKVLQRVFCDSTRIINSPSLSGDGRFVAFSGIDSHGKSDIYMYDLGKGNFRRLTDDFYDDVHPDWHPLKKVLVFSSDRCKDGIEGKYALYTIDTESLDIKSITDGMHHDTDPRWLQDGSGLLFASDREGVYDIFLLKRDRIIRQTNVLGGTFDPYPCTDGRSLLAAGYSGGTYRIYRIPLKDDALGIPVDALASIESTWKMESADSSMSFDKRDYSLRFGIDFIGAAFAVDPDFGYMGNGAQLFLTDLLGDHQLVILFGSASDDFEDFWRRVNLAFTYYNQKHRLNYAFGAFHLASYMGTYYDLLRFERRYGALGGLCYPLSKFTRVELTAVFKGMERDDDITYIGLEEGSSWLVSNYLSFTKDNIVWYIGGPIKGHRFNIAVGRTMDLQGSRYESTTLHFDLRNYINLGRRMVFAQRIVSRNAWGSDLQLFYLGGSWDLRGYNFREFAGKRTFLVNNELRFPLLDRLLIGFPFGNIDFPFFRGSLFMDMGRVSGFIYETEWLGSFGAGVEMNLGYLPVARVNFSRLTDFKTVEKGIKIDFFLGFNF